MNVSCLTLSLLLGSIHAAGTPDSVVLRTSRALRACRDDVPMMVTTAEQAAARLAAGGSLWAAGEDSFISEMCGRAGGLMMVKSLGDTTPARGDVVLFGTGTEQSVPDSLLQSDALVITFGLQNPPDTAVHFANHAADHQLSPSLGAITPAWIWTCELVAALTRLQKMPVVYETIGLYFGFPRIDRFLNKGILWHDPNPVPPVAPGVLGNRYIDAVDAMLLRVEKEQRECIDRAADWAKQAKNDGKRLYAYTMGHFVPIELKKSAFGQLFVTNPWNSGFDRKLPEQIYTQGDFIIHVGYQHPPYMILKCAQSAKARVVYIDILQHRDYVNDPNVIWIDPMWSWPDACVELEGYDILIVPASGIVNTALAWEIYRLVTK